MVCVRGNGATYESATLVDDSPIRDKLGDVSESRCFASTISVCMFFYVNETHQGVTLMIRRWLTITTLYTLYVYVPKRLSFRIGWTSSNGLSSHPWIQKRDFHSKQNYFFIIYPYSIILYILIACKYSSIDRWTLINSNYECYFLNEE